MTTIFRENPSHEVDSPFGCLCGDCVVEFFEIDPIPYDEAGEEIWGELDDDENADEFFEEFPNGESFPL